MFSRRSTLVFTLQLMFGMTLIGNTAHSTHRICMLWRANGHRSLDSKRNGSSRVSVSRMLKLNWNLCVMARDGQVIFTQGRGFVV